MVGKERERSLWNRVWPRGRKGAYGIKHTRPKTLAGWPCEVTSPSKLPQFRGNNKDHPHKNTVCRHIWSGLQFPFVYLVSSFPDGKMEMKINPNSKMAAGFPGSSVVKKLPASAGDSGSIPESGRFPRSKWQPTPVFLPEKSHGQRSLVGYSQRGHKDSDMTKQLNN